jgi:glycerol uptake facilitator-like aquaporin
VALEVNYAATIPGPWGIGGAFLGEFAITLCLMGVILAVSNTPRLEG